MAAARLVDELRKAALGRDAIAVIGDEPRLWPIIAAAVVVLAGETASHDSSSAGVMWRDAALP